MVQMEFPKLNKFLIGLQRSWEEAMKSMEIVQEAIKKARDNVWLESKNIHSNRPLKKLDQKRYRLFKISKDIGLEMFQLELPERWMIHNMFNEDLLTKYRKPHFKGQYMEPAPPPIIINKEEKYKVEEVRKH